MANLNGPVGMRGRSQNVANRDMDQRVVIGLLSKIAKADGGQREAWRTPPLSGGDGRCPKLLVDAIWDFQTVWKSKGVVRSIDGVADPGGTTFRQMEQLSGGRAPAPAPPPPKPAGGLISGPVGLRNRTQRVTSRAADQAMIIDLLAGIARADGGQREAWSTRPLSGPDGQCPRLLADAIFQFQTVQKRLGGVNAADGVVDPGGRTLNRMLLLTGRGGVPGPGPAVEPKATRIIAQPRIAGTWQITGISSITLGEVGQVGTVQLDISQPDEKKLRLTGVGAGFGVSVDPVSYIKALSQGAKALSPFHDAAKLALIEVLKMAGKGVAFSLGDYLALFDKISKHLGPLNATGGRIVPNPANALLGRPTTVTKAMIGGGAAPPPFMIMSAGGAFGAGMEGGIVFFGGPGLAAAAFGVYGTSGLSLKFGAGVQGLLFNPISLVDVK